MVDAKAVAPGAEPRIFTAGRMTATPQVAEADLLDHVHVVGGRIDRPRLVDKGPTGVEITNGQSVPVALGRDSGDQSLPIRYFGEEVWHVDAVQPKRGEF